VLQRAQPWQASFSRGYVIGSETAELMQPIHRCTDPTLPLLSRVQAQAYAFFRVIAPLVFQANATAGQAINFLLYPGQTNFLVERGTKRH
jgi:hypothetical protein